MINPLSLRQWGTLTFYARLQTLSPCLANGPKDGKAHSRPAQHSDYISQDFRATCFGSCSSAPHIWEDELWQQLAEDLPKVGWGNASQQHCRPWQVHEQCLQHRSQRRSPSSPPRTGSASPQWLSSCLPSRLRVARHLAPPCKAPPPGLWLEQSWDTGRRPSTRAAGSLANAAAPACKS